MYVRIMNENYTQRESVMKPLGKRTKQKKNPKPNR